MSKKLQSILAIFCMSLFGCATGQDSILFVTKTSIAVDIDTNPATFDVGYGRYEGSIAPVLDKGEVLPLLSSISSDAGISSSVFGTGVAQNFGVGNAAIIMSQYLGSPANPASDSKTTFSELISTPASVKGTTENGRRYFFGTKTTLGFATSFAAERGYSPDSISLGYKRKEFAYVPIRQIGAVGSETLSIPSMLATAGMSAGAGANEAGFSVSQFYATGQAANFLAAHPVIRNSVISKIIGDENLTQKLQEQAEQAVIKRIDIVRVRAELVNLKASNIIDGLRASQLDGALESLKVAKIADDDDAFRDDDSDGTISEAEKRKRLKALSQAFDDEELVVKIEKWVSENN